MSLVGMGLSMGLDLTLDLELAQIRVGVLRQRIFYLHLSVSGWEKFNFLLLLLLLFVLLC